MRNTLLILFSLVLAGSSFAQKQKLLAQSNYDYIPLHFGMSLDFSQHNLVPVMKDNFQSNTDLLSVETIDDIGLGVAFVLPDLRLNNRLNLRHIFSINTIQRNIIYKFNPALEGPSEVKQTVESWFVESAFHIKYRADRINNSRVFVFFGPSFGIDMASEKDVKDEKIFKLNRSNFTLEVGAGCDFYFEYFKLGPQIKYSYGLKNLIVQDGTVFTSPLEGFYSRGFQFSLTFE